MGKKKKKNQIQSGVKTLKGDAVSGAAVQPAAGGMKAFLFLAVILLLTAAVFSNTFQNEFTNWDDDKNVYENIYIRDITFDNLKVYFTKPLIGMYTPLVYLSYAIDYKIGELNPAAYHATNMLLHLINVTLVFFVIKLLTQRIEVALIVTLFFAIHPMNAAAVTPVSVRSSLLYSMFYLGSYLSYAAYLKDGFRKRYLVLSFMLFVLSVLSKSAAVVLPMLLLLTDWYYGRKFNSKAIIEKIPFLIVSIIFGIVMIIFRQDDVGYTGTLFTTFERIFLVSYALIFYIVKLFVPMNLSVFYPYPDKMDGFLPLGYYVMPFVLLLVAAAAIKAKKYRREIIFGALFFLVNLMLVLKIVPMGAEMVCDRYVYLPGIGVFFIFGHMYWRLYGNGSSWTYSAKNIILAAILVYAMIFSFAATRRNAEWKDSITLWNSVISKYPDVPQAYYNRGTARAAQGDYSGAIYDYNMAIERNPAFFEAYNNRGRERAAQRDYSGAIDDFNKAIELNPIFPEAYSNRGNAKAAQRDYEGALKDYQNAIEQNHEYAPAYINMGIAKFSLNDHSGACNDWQRALQLGNGQAGDMVRLYCDKIMAR